jgi:hypothetical protein
MPKVVVPSSIKNEAAKVVAGVLGVTTFATGAKIAVHHHNKAKEKLAAAGHSHKELQDHESTPAGHVVLHTT